MTACGDENGTYYTESDEMKKSIKQRIYSSCNYWFRRQKVYLSLCNKGKRLYLFYWIENDGDCEYFYNYLEESCADYNSLVQIENDKEFGNIVYCGTKKAVDSAGIRVVNVKVDVKI